MKRKCKRCKKEFIPQKNNKQIFCSGDCRFKHWIEHNRKRLNETVRKYRAKRYIEEGQWYENGIKAKELKAWMIELKSKPCTDCNGTFEICCMDFDHKDGTVKSYNIGSMFAHHYSRELIQKELDKCELVCSNCHRIRTQRRKIGSGKYGKKNKV